MGREKRSFEEWKALMKRKIIFILIFVALVATAIALTVYDCINADKLEVITIVKAVALLGSATAFLVKGLYGTGAPRNLKAYEVEYKKHIEYAFTREESKKERKSLLIAIDLYTKDSCKSAISRLEKLIPKCETLADFYAVKLIMALCYTDLGYTQMAIETYEEIVHRDPSKSTPWSNLGYQYSKLGNIKKALDCYGKAIEADPTNPYSYSNMANEFIKVGAYDIAIPYGIKALEIKSNMHQASNALAISYNAMSNYAEAERYFRMSVANGVEPEGLRSIMEYHKDAFVPYEEEEVDSEENEENIDRNNCE